MQRRAKVKDSYFLIRKFTIELQKQRPHSTGVRLGYRSIEQNLEFRTIDLYF